MDARFRFAMSEDGMKLGVNRYFPAEGGEGPSVALLRRQVLQAGVDLSGLDYDEAAAERIVQAVQTGREFRGIVLVRGVPVQEPEDARLVALGNLDYPVFPGDGFARKYPPLTAAPGRTISGQVLPPKSSAVPRDIPVEMGDNVELDPLTNAYVSTIYGMARLSDGVISVDPLFRIDEDEVTVSSTVFHKDFRGNRMSSARLEKELRDIGVAIDVELGAIDKAIARAEATGQPVHDVPIVQGKYPVPGRDGWLEYLVSTREDTGQEDESGRLDFRNRGAYPMVEAQQTIARLHGPTQGQGGIDIYGKTIPASGGRELVIHLGENVMLLEDKVTFVSRAKGIMVMERNVLSVNDCLLIRGDVDYGTGNVVLEHGSVRILGSVNESFSVSAPKHVVVGGSVESATITAGGCVEVSGGILMPKGGRIRADGDVVTGYATNARIEAGGDVHIVNEATNSYIHADGRIVALKGHGIIQGGETVCAKGVEAKEIGSDMGVITKIAVRIDEPADEELRQERARIKEAIRKIDETLGCGQPKEILARTARDKRHKVAAVIRHRIKLIERRKAISEELTRMALVRQERLAGIRIRVHHRINAGTVIQFGAKHVQIKKNMDATVIYWDPATSDLVFGSL
ncbi:FapA family protein [Pseudodesulfovibrio tunisiensis]|uniref:FapA family protein n=1 Tax=Pseudodesulfovibrio tunisiensis TaxID=463192 RepID=UPI001FB2FF52|nr:FapA family protein [Pseudodesulfovibrio tunisiensis]